MDIYLIRHTNTDIETGICYGQSDVGLSDSFPGECREVRSKLPAGAEDAVVYSSSLQRCRKLASVLATGKVHVDERLQELDFGDWELQKWDEIEAGRLRRWMDNYVNDACPGGESYLDLADRVIEWWNELLGKDFDVAVVVTHAGVIRCLISHVLEIPYSNSFRLEIDPGNISAVTVTRNVCKVKFVNR